MAKSFKNIGFKLLGVWLILEGLIQLFDLHFDGIGIVIGIIALLAGVLIIAEK